MTRRKSDEIEVVVHSYSGSQDGIRFGELALRPGGLRHYHLDRLNRVVRLYRGTKQGHLNAKPDRSKPNLVAALKAFMSLEPFP